MKSLISSFGLIFFSLTGICQGGVTDANGMGTNPNFNFTSSSFSTIPSLGTFPTGLYSMHNRHGNSFGNSGAVLDILSNKFGVRIPTRYRYQVNGVDFQAGLLSNTRQPKLGAGFSLTSGFNFSAGYGVGMNMNNFSRMGASSFSKNQGIQITAGYRLFRKK